MNTANSARRKGYARRVVQTALAHVLEMGRIPRYHVEDVNTASHQLAQGLGLKPCLHPLLAVIAEVRLVAQLWLRPGNSPCGGNATAFFLDLWENLPRHIRLRGVRADAGFCLPELLDLWEQLRLPYVVVAQLSQPIQKRLKSDLPWQPTEVPGTEVAELAYHSRH